MLLLVCFSVVVLLCGCFVDRLGLTCSIFFIQESSDQAEVTTYHLYDKKTKIFLAELITQNPDQPVHNQQLREGYGYFLITSIYLRSAMRCDHFDPDKHCVGSYMQWDMKSAKVRMLPRATSKALDTSGPQEVERGRERWRSSDPDQWKIIKRQQKRARGESYSPPAKKGAAPKPRKKVREMKAACTCRKQCSTRLSEEDRQSVFHTFWDLADAQKQTQYIINNIVVSSKDRERKRPQSATGKTRNRESTNCYYLNKEQVCKIMFHNTLDVSEQYVKTCLSNATAGISNSTHGLSGKPSNHRLTDQQIDSIVNHIKSFPVMESHYLREQTQ